MLKQRIITAAVLAPLALAGIFLLPLAYFQWFVLAILLLAGWEWANFCGMEKQGNRWSYAFAVAAILVLLAAVLQLPTFYFLIAAGAFWLFAFFVVLTYPQTLSLWSSPPVRMLMGLFVLLPTWQALVFLKALAPDGKLLLLLMLLVWGADIGAYFSGRAWGNKKLAPAVSPGKTMAGLYGGVAASLVVALALSLYWQLPMETLFSLMVVCLITVLASVLGDLFESMMKRHRGIKDSSQLLPGHGGIMDRIDSLTAAGPVFALGTWLIGLGL